MPVNFRKSGGKFPLEELIEQCNKAVETVEETVISVGKTFESSDSVAIKAVVQSPLAILERNIEKLRDVQNVVEEILKIKDEPICGTKFTKRQVTDATFRCVDYLAAFVAVALIIMETSDTAAKYLGETDVPKGFTAALVMVSKVLSALMDHRRKQELERQKFLTMLKDVEIKCRKIEEFAAIYNVFRSISALKNEGNLAFDQKSNCKEAVKVLKSMPDAKLSGDFAKNLKKQLSEAIQEGARDLVQERFRAIFDRNKPINVKRRLFDRWYNAYVISNRMSKIYKSNRFMLLESKEKLKFTYKQWAAIILKRKRVLERSRELMCGSPQAKEELSQAYVASPSMEKFTFENPVRRHSFMESRSAVEGAGVFSQEASVKQRQSEDSQSLGSEGEMDCLSSGDERGSFSRFSPPKSQRRGEVYMRRARSQRSVLPNGGYRSGSSESARSHLSFQEASFSKRADWQSQAAMMGYSIDPRFANSQSYHPGYAALQPSSTFWAGKEGLKHPQAYEQEPLQMVRQEPTLGGVHRQMPQMAEVRAAHPPFPIAMGPVPPYLADESLQREGNLSIHSSSRRSSFSSVEREVTVLGTQKEIIQQGDFRIESSFVYRPNGEEMSRGETSTSVEPIRLNLPLIPSISSTPTGQSSGFVVVQMPEKGGNPH